MVYSPIKWTANHRSGSQKLFASAYGADVQKEHQYVVIRKTACICAAKLLPRGANKNVSKKLQEVNRKKVK